VQIHYLSSRHDRQGSSRGKGCTQCKDMEVVREAKASWAPSYRAALVEMAMLHANNLRNGRLSFEVGSVAVNHSAHGHSVIVSHPHCEKILGVQPSRPAVDHFDALQFSDAVDQPKAMVVRCRA
jgi:hypothetical protein